MMLLLQNNEDENITMKKKKTVTFNVITKPQRHKSNINKKKQTVRWLYSVLYNFCPPFPKEARSSAAGQ